MRSNVGIPTEHSCKFRGLCDENCECSPVGMKQLEDGRKALGECPDGDELRTGLPQAIEATGKECICPSVLRGVGRGHPVLRWVYLEILSMTHG